MRRLLKIPKYLLLVAVLLAGALFAAFALTFAGTRAIIDGQEIAPGVRTVKDGHVSVFVLDAGPPQSLGLIAG